MANDKEKEKKGKKKLTFHDVVTFLGITAVLLIFGTFLINRFFFPIPTQVQIILYAAAGAIVLFNIIAGAVSARRKKKKEEKEEG